MLGLRPMKNEDSVLDQLEADESFPEPGEIDVRENFDLEDMPFLWILFHFLAFPLTSYFHCLQLKDKGFSKALAHLFVLLGIALVYLGLFIATIIDPQQLGLYAGLALLFGPLLLLTQWKKLRFRSLLVHPVSWRRFRFPALFLCGLFVYFNLISNLDFIEFQPLEEKFAPYFMEPLSGFGFVKNSILWSVALLLVLLAPPLRLFNVRTFMVVSVCSSVLYSQFFIFTQGIHGFLASVQPVNTVALLAPAFLLLGVQYLRCKGFSQYLSEYFLGTLPRMLNLAFLYGLWFGLGPLFGFFLSDYLSSKLQDDYLGSPLFASFLSDGNYVSGDTIQGKFDLLASRAHWSSESTEKVVPRSERLLNVKPDLASGELFPELAEFRSEDKEKASDLLFRPLHRQWDVFLASAKAQGILTNVEEKVAELKVKMSKLNWGELPKLDSYHRASLLEHTLGLKLYFLPATPEAFIEFFQKSMYPVYNLQYQGERQWVSLRAVSQDKKYVLLQKQLPEKYQKAVTDLFASDQQDRARRALIYRSFLVLPWKYFASRVEQSSAPLVLLANEGEGRELEEELGNQSMQIVRELVRKLHLGASHLYKSKQIIEKLKVERFQGPVLPPTSPQMKELVKDLHRKFLISMLRSYPKISDDQFLKPQAVLSQDDRVEILDWLLDSKLKEDLRIELMLFFSQYAGRLPRQFQDLLPKLNFQFPVDRELLETKEMISIGRFLYFQGKYALAKPYFEAAHYEIPSRSDIELWNLICNLQLGEPLFTPQSRILTEPGMLLYYRFLKLYKAERIGKAKSLLEGVLKRDPHDLMAIHLKHRYLKGELDPRFHFPTPEGL